MDRAAAGVRKIDLNALGRISAVLQRPVHMMYLSNSPVRRLWRGAW
jgi:hypothetical protein